MLRRENRLIFSCAFNDNCTFQYVSCHPVVVAAGPCRLMLRRIPPEAEAAVWLRAAASLPGGRRPSTDRDWLCVWQRSPPAINGARYRLESALCKRRPEAAGLKETRRTDEHRRARCVPPAALCDVRSPPHRQRCSGHVCNRPRASRSVPSCKTASRRRLEAERAGTRSDGRKQAGAPPQGGRGGRVPPFLRVRGIIPPIIRKIVDQIR